MLKHWGHVRAARRQSTRRSISFPKSRKIRLQATRDSSLCLRLPKGPLAEKSAGRSRTLESLLFEVKSRDPMVFAAVPILLAAVAPTAARIPALRAIKVDPIDALRYE